MAETITYLQEPRFEECSGATFTQNDASDKTLNVSYTSNGSPFTISVDYIPAGLTVYLYCHCYSSDGTAAISGPEQVELVPPKQGTANTFTYTSTGAPLVLTVSGSTNGYLSMSLYTKDPRATSGNPYDVTALDVWAPANRDALKWDQGRWDRDTWDKPQPKGGTFTWDNGHWDMSRWYDENDNEGWASIIGPCTSIKTVRGINTTGPILAAQVGTLTATARNLDPRALGITYGARIRLYHWPTRAPIFEGNISDIETSPDKENTLTTTLTAVDAVSQLANTTRYGAKPDTGTNETWRQRLSRLMTSTSVPYTVESSTDTPVCPTVWETSLAAHLDALTATVAGGWYVTRNNKVSISALVTKAAALTLSDTYDPPQTAGRAWYYTDAAAQWKASSLAATVEATTHNATKDAAGAWKANDVTASASNPTTAAAYGGMTVKVDVMTPPDVPTIQAAAQKLLRRAQTVPTLGSVTLRPVSALTTPTTQQKDMADASSLDPLTPCLAVQRDETALELIAQVTHEISPNTWTTQLTLTPLEQDTEGKGLTS